MDERALIENLISAIETIFTASDGINNADLQEAVEDAKETAGLAKLILPSLQPATPVGEWVVYVDGTDEVVGMFPDEAAALTWLNGSGADGTAYKIQTGTAAVAGAVAPNPGPTQVASSPYPPCPNCGHPQDAGGCAFGCNQQQSTPGIGSVIANKPPGSLYKR